MSNNSTAETQDQLEKAMQALRVARRLQRDKLNLGADYVNVEGEDDNSLPPNTEADVFSETNNELSPIASEDSFSYTPLTPQQQQEAIERVALWLQNYPEAEAVRTQYLTLVDSQGTLEQQQEAIREIASWLASQTDAASVWEKYLILIGKVGTRQQQIQALAQTIEWLTSHPQNVYVREQYLELVEKVGTRQQQQEAIAQTIEWLQSHPEDRYVREQYLALVGKAGTRQQQQWAVAETTIWLQSHPQDQYVREQYLTLVAQLGSATTPAEPTRRINLRLLHQVLSSTSIRDAMNTLLDSKPELRLAFRSTSADRWQNIPSQGITLDSQTVLLTIETRPEEEEKFSIRVQLKPTRDKNLPEGVKLILLSPSGDVLYEDEAESNRELIEVVLPDGERGDSFNVQVALGDASVTEYLKV